MTEARWLANYDEGVPTSLEPYPSRTLIDYLREAANKWPDRPALLFKGATVSYADLQSDSDAFAAALASLGVKAGDRVAICLPNCPQFMVAEFGAWKIGAIACPFNPTYTERETEDALQATGAETVVVLNRFYGKIKSIQSRTAVKRVIATGIKEYLPWHLKLGYTLLKEGKEGERITLSDGDHRYARLLRRFRGAAIPEVQARLDAPAAHGRPRKQRERIVGAQRTSPRLPVESAGELPALHHARRRVGAAAALPEPGRDHKCFLVSSPSVIGLPG